MGNLKCPVCEGARGDYIFTFAKHRGIWYACAYCNGRGHVPDDPELYVTCPDCNGRRFLVWGIDQDDDWDVIYARDTCPTAPADSWRYYLVDREGRRLDAEVAECPHCGGSGRRLRDEGADDDSDACGANLE